MKLDGVADVFTGKTTIVHMEGDAELDEEVFLATLKKAGGKKLKIKGKLTKNSEVLL